MTAARPLVVLAVAAAWVGAAVLLSVSVAPAAFATLPSRTLAGALVGQVLPPLFLSGIAGAGVAGVLGGTGPSAAHAGARIAAAAAWGAPCALALLVVMPRIERIRQTVGGPIDALTPGDPRRLAFGRLHATSVGLLGVAIVAAIAIAVLAALAAAATHPSSDAAGRAAARAPLAS